MTCWCSPATAKACDAPRGATSRHRQGREQLVEQARVAAIEGRETQPQTQAEVGAVYDITPVARSPAHIMQRSHNDTDDEQPVPVPAATGKWLTASVIDDAAQIVTAIFDAADRRDPHHRRRRVALLDGNNHQIETIHTASTPKRPNATSRSRSSSTSFTSLSICGRPAGRSSTKPTPLPKPGSRTRPYRSLNATPARSPPESAGEPPATGSIHDNGSTPTGPPPT
jgi:hypothetical protein